MLYIPQSANILNIHKGEYVKVTIERIAGPPLPNSGNKGGAP